MKNRLKELRKIHQYSQAALARSLEISRQAVNGFESGKFTPSLEMALKIASLFDVAIEEIFLYEEKNVTQTFMGNLIQWLPKRERFTIGAIQAIQIAQQQAASSVQSQVEPQNLIYGLLADSTTTAASLLQNHGLNVKPTNQAQSTTPKVTLFSSQSQYVLELALQSARLERRKYIGTEDLLWGILQLTQRGDRQLNNLFQRYEIDIQSLTQALIEQNS